MYWVQPKMLPGTGYTGSVPYQLKTGRLKGILAAKGLERKDLLDMGFTPAQVGEWLYRVSPGTPGAVDAVKLAVRLQVPVEWLFGARTRYDRFGRDYARVAAEASLDVYLETTREGGLVSPDAIPVLRAEAQTTNPPHTVPEWKSRLEALLRGAAFGQTRNAPLHRMMRDDVAGERGPNSPVEPPSRRGDRPGGEC